MMKFYSTNHNSEIVGLSEAILHSEAADGGLFMPCQIPKLPKAFFNNIAEMSPTEISYFVANSLFSPDIPSAIIKKIGDETFSFPMPLIQVEPNIYSYELFHGPTFSVKDIGTRFLARLLVAMHVNASNTLNLLVATSGNSGSAITHGFHGVEGINVFVLYPKTTPLAFSSQFSSLGGNIHAIRVNGSIDDCRSLVATALSDTKLNEKMDFTSANSVNIGRVLPQVITFFQAYALMKRENPSVEKFWFSVPCGNAGNLFAGHIAREMGLPIEMMIAACNANGSFVHYLNNGKIAPDVVTKRTLAYALDNAHPANIPRFDDICHGDVRLLRKSIIGDSVGDDQIIDVIRTVNRDHNYLMGPHSAISYKCLKNNMPGNAKGVFMATAHPARSYETMCNILGFPIKVPARLKSEKQDRPHETLLAPTFPAMRKFLLQKIGK